MRTDSAIGFFPRLVVPLRRSRPLAPLARGLPLYAIGHDLFEIRYVVGQTLVQRLPFAQRDRHDPYVRALRHDRDRLLVSARVQGQVGREWAGVDSRLDAAGSDAA